MISNAKLSALLKQLERDFDRVRVKDARSILKHIQKMCCLDCANLLSNFQEMYQPNSKTKINYEPHQEKPRRTRP